MHGQTGICFIWGVCNLSFSEDKAVGWSLSQALSLGLKLGGHLYIQAWDLAAHSGSLPPRLPSLFPRSCAVPRLSPVVPQVGTG